jgi:hypothetical protein
MNVMFCTLNYLVAILDQTNIPLEGLNCKKIGLNNCMVFYVLRNETQRSEGK